MAFISLSWWSARREICCSSHCELVDFNNKGWCGSIRSEVLLQNYFANKELYIAGKVTQFSHKNYEIFLVPKSDYVLCFLIGYENSYWWFLFVLSIFRTWLVVQAESALDQMDWIEKITGVIASLLSSQAPERVICYCLSFQGFVAYSKSFYIFSVCRLVPWVVVTIDLPVRVVHLRVLILITRQLRITHPRGLRHRISSDQVGIHNNYGPVWKVRSQ